MLEPIVNADFGISLLDAPMEVVERKGLGHPDTLADFVADQFVCDYAKFTLANFGVVLNLNVDKVLLVGAISELSYGSAEIIRPARAILAGKITEYVGRRRVPIQEIFKRSVATVFSRAVDPDMVAEIECEVFNNNRPTPDHEFPVYRPTCIEDVIPPAFERRAADSVVIAAEGPLTPLEELTISIERELTFGRFAINHPGAGTDVKVLAQRQGQRVSIVACVPAKAPRMRSRKDYDNLVDCARDAIADLSKECSWPVEISVNTKDATGGVYLTAFGTSLDKGDYGAVGRGNGSLGVSSLGRWRSMEAIAGKNPYLHPGKIYANLASQVVGELSLAHSGSVRVIVTARNGDRLVEPWSVAIHVGGRLDEAGRADLTRLGSECLSGALGDLDKFSEFLWTQDAISNHVGSIELGGPDKRVELQLPVTVS